MKSRTALLTAILCLTAITTRAQTITTENGWNVRTDKPVEALQVGNESESDIFMEEQKAGLRITTGPRAIYWKSGDIASGIFNLRSTLRLYDPNGRNREGYGLFLGGSELDTEQIKYLYFLLRNTGDYLIKIRNGAETRILKDWTTYAGIQKFNEGSSMEYARNELGVHVKEESVLFLINGATVHTVEKSELDPNGVFGIRINHAVDLMVEELTLDDQ